MLGTGGPGQLLDSTALIMRQQSNAGWAVLNKPIQMAAKGVSEVWCYVLTAVLPQGSTAARSGGEKTHKTKTCTTCGIMPRTS